LLLQLAAFIYECLEWLKAIKVLKLLNFIINVFVKLGCFNHCFCLKFTLLALVFLAQLFFLSPLILHLRHKHISFVNPNFKSLLKFIYYLVLAIIDC